MSFGKILGINKYSMSFTYPCPRKLRQVMKMSLIQRQPSHVIKDIWIQYHEPRVSNTADILEKEKYMHLINKTNRCPISLIPILRNNGHFKLITQWQDNCFLCTYLQDFKKYGKNAQPYIVYTFFTELLFNKGITLVRSDIINNSMTKTQALRTWQLLTESYLNQEKYNIVDKLNNRQDEYSEQQFNRIYHIQ